MALHHPKPRFGYDPTTLRIYDYGIGRDVDVVPAYEAIDGTWNLELVRDQIMKGEPIESAHLKVISKPEQAKIAAAKEKELAAAKAKKKADEQAAADKANADAKKAAEADAKAAAKQAEADAAAQKAADDAQGEEDAKEVSKDAKDIGDPPPGP